MPPTLAQSLTFGARHPGDLHTDGEGHGVRPRDARGDKEGGECASGVIMSDAYAMLARLCCLPTVCFAE